MTVDVEKIKAMVPPAGGPFRIQKIGHVVLNVVDLERSAAFYTGVLGFRISDVYPESMMRGGMVSRTASPASKASPSAVCSGSAILDPPAPPLSRMRL